MHKAITARYVVAGAAGGALAIGLMELVSAHAAFPLMFVPFATSIVLVMGTPDAEPAQPRALVGGHLVAAAVGLLTLAITGPLAELSRQARLLARRPA